VAAVVEACTWVGLLAGMAVKYLGSGDEIGVHIFGPLHGAAFIAYVAVALWAAWRLGWSWGLTLLALAASIPPLATWAFEVWCQRSGRLSLPERQAQDTPVSA
jgi:integral membrane protein